jgi:hypothetical protein
MFPPALLLRSTVWLFDPPQHALEPALVPCTIVIAAGPNIRHYGNFLREDKLVIYTVNPYTAEEAEEFLQLVGANISASDFAERYFQVIIHRDVTYVTLLPV